MSDKPMNDKPKPQRNFMMKPEDQPPFAGLMGMKITHASPERSSRARQESNSSTLA